MKNKAQGFTLLEILIALFIFTILSTLLIGALHSVIGALSGTEKHAERLRNLQLVLLVLSRDIEQTVDRPVMSASGQLDKAFIGTRHDFIFTHLGNADPTGTMARSALQRTQYVFNEGKIWRKTWPVLDQAPQTKANLRPLLADLISVHFQYLDNENHFHHQWPPEGSKLTLPQAVKITLRLTDWGSLSQLYVIPAKSNESK